jgi:hypothetical protein
MQDGASIDIGSTAHTSNAILGNDEKRIEGYIREKNITLLTWPFGLLNRLKFFAGHMDMNLSK